MDLPDDNIPEDAKIALLISNQSPDSLFKTVRDSLQRFGYLINQENRKLGAISTRSRNIGKKIQMRMSFLIEPIQGNDSRVTIRSEWRKPPNLNELKQDEDIENPEAIGWKVAEWKDPHESRKAFAHMVKFIHRLPGLRITYN